MGCHDLERPYWKEVKKLCTVLRIHREKNKKNSDTILRSVHKIKKCVEDRTQKFHPQEVMKDIRVKSGFQ